MWIRFSEQLKSLKTNGKRKNVWSIFLILKPKYVGDLTLDLSDKKTDKNNQQKDSATQQVLTNHQLCTTHNQQQEA
jgi:hypothetical protein